MEGKINAQKANVSKFITLCEAVLNMPEPNISKSYLEGNMKIISELWVKIDTTHDELIIANNATEQANYGYFKRKEYENAFGMYSKITVKIIAKLEKFTTPPQAQPIQFPGNVTISKSSNIKLKPIDIPIFSGDYKKWISFKNMFDSLVHNDAGITKLQKIHYLKSCLTGEAERVISQYDITENSYDPAYAAITERFHNEVILIDTHIISILSQPNLSSESSNGIKELMDVTNENLLALKSLNVDTSTWDPILLLLLIQKLDDATRRLWEQNLKPKVRPTMKEFMDFLSIRFHALGCQQKFTFSISSSREPGESQHRNSKSQFNNSSHHKSNYGKNNFIPRFHQNFHSSTEPQSSKTQRKCPLRCGGSHIAIDCERFQKASVRSKNDLVACANLCRNCLKGHGGTCSLQPGCRQCGQYHHTSLHFDEERPNQSTQNSSTLNAKNVQPQQNTATDQSPTALNTHHSRQIEKQSAIKGVNDDPADLIAWDEPVLLATAIILIRSQRDGRLYPFRALLDQASEASYISEYATQFLGLNKINVFATTSGLGGVKTGEIKSVVDFEVNSKRNPAFQFKVQAPVVHKISNPIPSIRLEKHNWKHIQDIPLADPQFYAPGKIDCLLGATVYGYLLLPGLRKISPQVPIAQNTEFGWILSGATRTPNTPAGNISTFHLRINLEDQLKKFFDQEEISKERVLTQEEKECERFFKETHSRNSEGRFIVALPFKSDPKALGSSKGQAMSRLMKLESKFKSNKVLKEEYTGILKEYENLGHVTKLGQLSHQNEEESYYLPHHAVFKPESTTTKTRVVFDASAKSTNGISLNDLLMTGPTLQEELSTILIRWRSHEVVFSADITKMYRQVIVREEDRKYQKFLFRKEETGTVEEYQHNMVTFGVKSATYLSVKALQQSAEDRKEKYPEASKIVLQDFYMDDVMSGADSVEHGKKICKDLKELLAEAKFELRKFISNSAELLESIPEEDRELKLPLEINVNHIKTLGILYDPLTDTFQFRVNLKNSTQQPTKRSLLSDTAKLFDPLGWLAPMTIKAKILYQQLWQEGLSWEQELPEHIAKTWMELRNDLQNVEKIRINRWIHRNNQTKIFELHGFSDASKAAYSAVVYARVVNRDGSIHITLITAKTRVAPIKPITLNRLELCGAVLLANLMDTVQKALRVDKENVHNWTDSTVVLGWLRTAPSKLKTYVANRVVEIQDLYAVSQWHHIEGKNNPADCASRGLSPSELEKFDLWWNGPECLRNHTTSWDQKLEIPPTTLELKSNVLSTFLVIPNKDMEDILDRYSSFKRLARITAICLKFLDNSNSSKSTRITALCLKFVNSIRLKATKEKISTSVLTVEEIQRAEKHLIRLEQRKKFKMEIDALEKMKPIHRKSKVLPLNPFLDSDGLLRVGGRLDKANIPHNRKHPFILAKGKISTLIIADCHLKSLHGGTQLTMNLVRDSFWIINLRRQIKKHILHCVTCIRFRQNNGVQLMGNLPEPRVNETTSFTHTGVDYAGPFDIKASNIRCPPTRIKPIIVNGEVIKTIPRVPVYEGYIALFVCLSTKAIHLEAVSDQTTEAFLAALTRFTSRRSCPEHMYSDNGSTFIGTKNVLALEKEKSLVDYEQVSKQLNDEGITWHFIPPRTPHYGGIWESGIGSMKHHLKRIVGNATLTFEELITVLAKIEACLNSRPLCPLTDDPNDLSVLTPGHFLIGKELLAPPTGKSVTPKKGTWRERWRLQESIQKDFWKIWSQEYLSRLQQRPKWRTQMDNLKVGDMVLSMEDNLPPLKWPIARVIKIHPGHDLNVRIVKIKTVDGEYDRPIVKLSLLPTTGNDNPEETTNPTNGTTQDS